MHIRSRIRYEGAIAALIKKREWNREVEEPSWTAPGLLWSRAMRPKHFLPSGAREYGYAPRKGEGLPFGSREFRRSYLGQKWRLHHHQLPLVFTGELRRQTSRTTIRATSRGVKVIMFASKANYRHPNSRVQMREELTAVSAPEVRELTREKERAQIRAIRQVRARVEKTV